MSAIHDRRLRKFLQAGLYLVTSETMSAGRRTPDIIRAALAGGVKLVQLREKELAPDPFVELAGEARRLTADAGALLIINDRLDVALAVGADGVHLGRNDTPVDEARRLAPDLIIGASSHSMEEALDAEKRGASYVNIGPLFPTKTKAWDSRFLGLEGLKRIAPAVSIPFTVMGGIKMEHVRDLAAAGARTLAVITAITAAPDPEQAARAFLAELARCHG